MSRLIIQELRTNEIQSQTGIRAIGIAPDGLTSIPKSPAFYGVRQVASVGWENINGTYVYNVAVTNRGGCYNTSTGVFTCPIDGVYACCPGMLSGANGHGATLQIYKNGVNVTARGAHTNTVGNSNWFYDSAIFMIRCVKNDILTVNLTTGGPTVYGESGYSQCAIWLYQ